MTHLSAAFIVAFAASIWSTDIADVIYYPHAESEGVKQAFQVGCWRQEPSQSWTCDPAEIRRSGITIEYPSFRFLGVAQIQAQLVRNPHTPGISTLAITH